MIQRMLKVYKAVSRTFHLYVGPIFPFFGIFLLHFFVSIGMVLDHLFFPSLRKKQIRNPIVIVGNPRSGTTFLQRFLVENGFGTGSRLWKMIYPSLTLQTLIRPLLPILEKFSGPHSHITI